MLVRQRLSRFSLGDPKQFIRTFTSFKKDVCVFGKGKKTEQPFETQINPTNIGEDSYFLIDSPNRVTFGVADGVGGWTLDKDGRPDLVSQHLMKHCETVVGEYKNVVLQPQVSSQVILAQAYERLQANPPGLGSTTALVGV